MTYETLLLEINENVGVPTLNRPDRCNTLNSTMQHDLLDVLSACNEIPDVRALVITSADRFFCADGDLKEKQTEDQT